MLVNLCKPVKDNSIFVNIYEEIHREAKEMQHLRKSSFLMSTHNLCFLRRNKENETWQLSATYWIPPVNYKSKKDPMKALGRIDFTKYALSTINYLLQSSENG